MVEGLRLKEVSKGLKNRSAFDCEAEGVKYARRSVVSTVKIAKGTIITKEMIDIKRPGTGIPPKDFDKVLGSKALTNIEDDTPIKTENILKQE